MQVIGVNNLTGLPSERFLRNSVSSADYLSRFNEHVASIQELEVYCLFADQIPEVKELKGLIRKLAKQYYRRLGQTRPDRFQGVDRDDDDDEEDD